MDEVAECALYDAYTSHERTEIAKKKIRKVYQGRPISVRFRMRNPLLIDIEIQHLKIVASGVRYTGNSLSINFKGKEETEIDLKIVPEETGDIQISKIEWDLMGKFKCEFQLTDSEHNRLLHAREKMFTYKVVEQSAELDVKLTLLRDMNMPIIHNESSLGQLEISSTS